MSNETSMKGDERYDELLDKMQKSKDKWDKEDKEEGLDDDNDRLLSEAIGLAIEQGRGWHPGEKEAYLERILDDDFIPPIFASTQEEVEASGLQDAFTSLIYDNESPISLMLSFKKKGNDAFGDGVRNKAKNIQYYRDAVNHYYEAIAWAVKVTPMAEGDLAQADTDEPTYTEEELDEVRSSICANSAMAHMKLKNWGHVRDTSNRALAFSKTNVKAWYRLAKAHQMLQNWEEAGNAIESGLAVKGEENNVDLKKLEKLLADKVRKARNLRQQRERARGERVSKVKEVWKHCKENEIKLGRVRLVASVTDDEENEEDRVESRWHNHLPNSGRLPSFSNGESSWPCMFMYPSHRQSDFVEHLGESEMIAIRLAQMFPELEDVGETQLPWDFNNEFYCSNLAIYFEVHRSDDDDRVYHPEEVELLRDQGSCMRFYESSRALKGDEGIEMSNVVRAVERKHLYQQRKAWKKQHGSLWSKREECPVVRVHPAMTLRDVLVDSRMVVPNVSHQSDRPSLVTLVKSTRLTISLLFSSVPCYFFSVSGEASSARGLSKGAQMSRSNAARVNEIILLRTLVVYAEFRTLPCYLSTVSRKASSARGLSKEVSRCHAARVNQRVLLQNL
jgi:hypothetical protein